MRSGAGLFLASILLQIAMGAGSAAPARATADTLSTARAQYGDAMKAIDKGSWTEYEHQARHLSSPAGDSGNVSRNAAQSAAESRMPSQLPPIG